MSQQLECEVARPGYKAGARHNLAPEGRKYQGKKSSFIKAWRDCEPHCESQSAVEGSNDLQGISTKCRKRSQVGSTSSLDLHPYPFFVNRLLV